MWIIKNTSFHLLLLTLAVVCVYIAGLSGSFYFDDEWNLLQNPSIQLSTLDVQGFLSAAQSGTAGMFGRPVASLTFALNHVFSGFDPYFFKLTNLFIHISCGFLVYAVTLILSRQLLGVKAEQQKLFAFLVSAIWLLHPINLTPVLYVVQRMTSLSALFCLMGMFTYCKARQQSSHHLVKAVVLLLFTYCVFLPLGMLSKEDAVLLPAYCLIIELIFFRFQSPCGELNRKILLMHVLFVVIPGLLVSFYWLANPEWLLDRYIARDFSLVERVMTESRVLIFYISQCLVPLNSALSLFHDDFEISTGLFDPITTFLSLFSIFSLLILGLSQIRTRPAIAFAILFFFCAHILESTVIALELVHEHRNYLASYSICFALAYYFFQLSSVSQTKAVLVAVFVIMFFAATTASRAATWGNPSVHALKEVFDHPESPRANYQVGKRFAIYASSLSDSEQKTYALEQAAHYFGKSSVLRESYTDGLFGLLMLEGIEGRPMQAQDSAALLNRLAQGAFNNNNYNYLNSMFACLEQAACQLAESKVDLIIEASQKNLGFRGRHRAAVLANYNQYKSKQ